MGKKLCTNPKAIEARERKLEKKDKEILSYQKKKEEELWKETDKIVIKKLARKNDREEKRLLELQRKQNLKKIAEEELENMQGKSIIKPNPRVTKKQIEDKINMSGPIGSSTGVNRSPSLSASMQENYQPKNLKKSSLSTPLEGSDEEEIFDDIPQNINRTQDDVIHAKGVDAAIEVLQKISISESTSAIAIDRHPEKREFAAFKLYQEKEMARLKEESPHMKFSQMKEAIFKSWQRSPENPLFIHRINANSAI